MTSLDALKAEIQAACGHPDATIPVNVHTLARLLDCAEALEGFADRMGKMMQEYELPETCNGIICGELDAANAILDPLEALHA